MHRRFAVPTPTGRDAIAHHPNFFGAPTHTQAAARLSMRAAMFKRQGVLARTPSIRCLSRRRSS
jgi:hypothetical protein